MVPCSSHATISTIRTHCAVVLAFKNPWTYLLWDLPQRSGQVRQRTLLGRHGPFAQFGQGVGVARVLLIILAVGLVCEPALSCLNSKE